MLPGKAEQAALMVNSALKNALPEKYFIILSALMNLCGKSIFVFLLCLAAFLHSNLHVQAQDRIIRTNKDTVLVKVVEMTGDKIKFRRYGLKNGPILEIYKNQVSKIIYENGSELEIIYDSYYVSPDLLIKPPQSVIKIDFLSPLLNHLTLGYERCLKIGFNLDLKAAVIGFRINESLDYSEGVLVKAGIKKIWVTESISRGLKYKHPINGKYIKPELIFSYFDNFTEKGKVTYTNYALVINFGNQYILWDFLTLDYYAGFGYGLQYSSYDPTSTYDRNNVDLNYNHSHTYFGRKLPLVLNGGVTVGVFF
ncbi:MAG TPA: hypothetical protein PKH56_11685 [Saprospiraceae bacterium]|nr:hypothetical protein [Saprospiraceae bacterium]